MTPLEQTCEIQRLHRELRSLVSVVTQCLGALDQEIRKPSNVGRGMRIVAVANALEMAKDRAKHFGLGMKL